MTTTLRNVQVAHDRWNDGTDPKVRAWKEMRDYSIYRDAIIKAGQSRSPALPLSLLVSAHKAGLRVDQIAQGTGVSVATVTLALRRNGLSEKSGRRGRKAVVQCVDAQPLPVILKVVALDVPHRKRAPVLKGVSPEERARLREEFYAVSERLRKLGLTFENIAALSGRAVQSVHQWRIRKAGNYPAPPQEVVDDLHDACKRHEAVLSRARSLLESLA